MKKTLIVLSAAALLLAACSSASAEKPIVGTPGQQTAVDFKVDLIDGGAFSLSNTLGDKPVVLNFWASWCPPCRQEMPGLDQVALNTPGVQFIGIAINDDPSNAISYAQQIDVHYPIGIDGNYVIEDAYGIHVLPQTWLIDQNGTVVRTIQGAVSADQLAEYIEDDLGVKAQR
jgi:thiol-disulfide isomerase/thioredoxin